MANEVATTQAKPEIVKFGEQLAAKAEQIKHALPSHIRPELFQRSIISAAQGDPELLKADRASLVLACIKAAQDGLLPDKREAAIVVFKESKKTDAGWQTRLIATYMPMVYGLRKKILQSGEVVTLEVNVVYRAEVDAGKFFYEVGLEPPLRHRPMMELTEEQTRDSEIVAAYSIATMADGKKSYEVMRRFEIDRVRETSKTGATRDKQGKTRTPSGPWVDWFPEMAKKTVMRRHAKTLPQSGDIIVDVEGREQERSMQTAAILHGQEPDQPLIEHRGEDDLPPHDEESGELTDDRDEAPDQQEEAPKRKRRTKAEIEADKAKKREEGMPAKRQTEQEQRQAIIDEEEERENGAVEEGSGEATAEEAEAEALGEPDESINDFEIVAEDLITSFKKAATVIDLERLYNDSDESRSTMPEHIASVVESSYQLEKRRLKGGA